jgi:hypothetical protein
VFPFSELHPNAGARLRQEILLLPNHLLNPRDASSEPDVTNVQPSSSTSYILQGSTKKIEQNGVSIILNTCDQGVFVQPLSVACC